ncbi:MAG: hypothetical protein ABFC89_10425 [Methanospirillum sp.]
MMKPVGLLFVLPILVLLAAGCTSTTPMTGGGTPTPTYGMMGGSGYGTGYGMMNGTGDGAGYGMMQTVEERSMNASDHAEMQGLMEKMIAGTMTPAEQDRLVQLMNQYPAGYSTMLDRMMGYGTGTCGTAGGFWQGMPYYGTMLIFMPVAMVLGGLFLLVWLIVGLLAILWLLGQRAGR